MVQVSGIPNAGYDGVFVITAVGTHSFSYMAAETGLPTINDFSLDNGKQIGTTIPLAKNISTLSESGSTVTVNTNGASA